MEYTVVYTRQAEAELLAFSGKVQRQLASKIARLQGGFTGDIKKLQAADKVCRLRSGAHLSFWRGRSGRRPGGLAAVV